MKKKSKLIVFEQLQPQRTHKTERFFEYISMIQLIFTADFPDVIRYNFNHAEPNVLFLFKSK